MACIYILCGMLAFRWSTSTLDATPTLWPLVKKGTWATTPNNGFGFRRSCFACTRDAPPFVDRRRTAFAAFELRTLAQSSHSSPVSPGKSLNCSHAIADGKRGAKAISERAPGVRSRFMSDRLNQTTKSTYSMMSTLIKARRRQGENEAM